MNRLKLFVLVGWILLAFFSSLHSQSFTKIILAGENGFSEGGNWIDYDNDDDLDLFIPNNPRSPALNFLYRNNGDGTFLKINSGIVVTDPVMTESGTWGDYDNDGDIDLFVADGGFDLPRFNSLYRNEGGGEFTEITTGPIPTELGYSTSSSWGDYDNNGYLDLYCANFTDQNNTQVAALQFLYHNNGDGTFSKITSGSVVSTRIASFGMSWGDYDNDNDIDLFVCNFRGNNFLFRNETNGIFTRMAPGQAGSLVNDGGASIACSWGDYDNDQDLDLFVANFGTNNFLYRNNGDGTFTRILSGPVVTDGGLGEGSGWADFDNDGDLDLFVSNGQDSNPVINFFYRNDGNGNFVRINPDNVFGEADVTAGICWGDYDNDGDQDLFVAKFHGDPSAIYRNEGNDHNWINIKCTGTVSNRSAIGTKVRIKAGIDGVDTWQMREISAQTGYNGQNSLRASFGLRNAIVVDSIVIEWPSGTIDVLSSVAANQFLTVEEGSTLTGINADYSDIILQQTTLQQNYPNPFNPSTNIGFRISEFGFVKLAIFDVSGRLVKTLVNENRGPGEYDVNWDATDEAGRKVTSGPYLYRLEAAGLGSTKKLLVIR